jgi:hypothetical protein
MSTCLSHHMIARPLLRIIWFGLHTVVTHFHHIRDTQDICMGIFGVMVMLKVNAGVYQYVAYC